MSALAEQAAPITAYMRAYGVRFAVWVNDRALLPALLARLPPGARECHASREGFNCAVFRSAGAPAIWYVRVDTELQATVATEAEALDIFEGAVQFEVARRASLWTFVHAGTVGWNGRAILIPGESHSGKSTLVKALVQAGATYYSDEFAVLDRHGLVYPFSQPLTQRIASGGRERLTAAALGGTTGTRALPVGMVVSTSHTPGASWNPARVSPGEGLLALLRNTVRAQEAPARVMRLLARVAETAAIFEGTRGEAEETAALLLDRASWPSDLRNIA